MCKTVRNLKFSQALLEILFQVDEQTPPKVPVHCAVSSQGVSVLIRGGPVGSVVPFTTSFVIGTARRFLCIMGWKGSRAGWGDYDGTE